jgi:hypothetical protein
MCIIAYSTLYWFIFQRGLCISLHISDNIVYFASYWRQDCVFCFIFQTRLFQFASYFRQDCIFGVCPVNFNCDAGYPYCHWCIFDLNEKWVTFQIIYLCNQRISKLNLSSMQTCVVKFIIALWREQWLS